MKGGERSRLIPAAELRGEGAEETAACQELVNRASQYLSTHRWCGEIRELHAGLVHAGIIGVFLARIVPLSENVDEWLWVVVGDVPPAYLVTDEAPTPEAALQVYIDEMSSWVRAVERGEAVDDLMPVNVPPSAEAARLLSTRLDFLRRHVL
jgi:hypothetical protein